MSSLLWFFFALGAVCAWGSYGPMIHEGNIGLKSPWKTILCVGGAYFLIGVIIPTFVLRLQKAAWDFPAKGLLFASIGGALGALGAICVVAALKSGGKPLYVMPLVFGGAPLVNVIVSSLMHRPATAPSPLLYVGFLLVVVGAGMVLYYKP